MMANETITFHVENTVNYIVYVPRPKMVPLDLSQHMRPRYSIHSQSAQTTTKWNSIEYGKLCKFNLDWAHSEHCTACFMLKIGSGL